MGDERGERRRDKGDERCTAVRGHEAEEEEEEKSDGPSIKGSSRWLNTMPSFETLIFHAVDA